MTVYTDRPHRRARWIKPLAYRASVADPPRTPRFVILRSSCGHLLGVGYVWGQQGFVVWKSCR